MTDEELEKLRKQHDELHKKIVAEERRRCQLSYAKADLDNVKKCESIDIVLHHKYNGSDIKDGFSKFDAVEFQAVKDILTTIAEMRIKEIEGKN